MVTVAVVIIAAILRTPGRRTRFGPVLLVSAVVAAAATRVMLAEHHITDVLGTAIGYAGVAMAAASRVTATVTATIAPAGSAGSAARGTAR